MNDMPSGGPALSGRCALEQMGETTNPIEISDGEAKAVRACVTSLLPITIIHSTLTDLLVRQASSLTTGDEQNQCWQARNELQARRV